MYQHSVLCHSDLKNKNKNSTAAITGIAIMHVKKICDYVLT